MLFSVGLIESIKWYKMRLETHTSAKRCPLCYANRVTKDCKCPQYMTYAYMHNKGRTLRILNKSKQRGGPSRLLSTSLNEHLEAGNLRNKFSDEELDSGEEEEQNHDQTAQDYN